MLAQVVCCSSAFRARPSLVGMCALRIVYSPVVHGACKEPVPITDVSTIGGRTFVRLWARSYPIVKVLIGKTRGDAKQKAALSGLFADLCALAVDASRVAEPQHTQQKEDLGLGDDEAPSSRRRKRAAAKAVRPDTVIRVDLPAVGDHPAMEANFLSKPAGRGRWARGIVIELSEKNLVYLRAAIDHRVSHLSADEGKEGSDKEDTESATSPSDV